MIKTLVDFWKRYDTTIVLVVLLSAYIGSAVIFAQELKPAIIPDEPHHFIVSVYFSETWGIPSDTTATIALGGLSHKPFLFHWINGRVINLLDWIMPGVDERILLVALRLLSVLYSTISVLYSYLLAREIIVNRWGQVFVVFLITNTLMFVFISSGNSYDNLLNLCSFAGIYYFILVIKGDSFYRNSLLWLITILTGLLIKVTMLPLAALTVIIWLLYLFKRRHIILDHPKWNWKWLLGFGIIVLLAGINFSIYGVNLIKYHTVFPACIQTYTEEQCLNYPQYIRDQELGLQDKLSLTDVIQNGYADPFEWGTDFWIIVMLQRIYGIMGHQSYYPDVIITAHRFLLLWLLFITVRYWEKPSFVLSSLYIVLLGYGLILFMDNYNTELYYGFKHVGIQGRYLFPVIGVYYVLVTHAFEKISKPAIRFFAYVFTTLLFLFGGPVIFLLRFYNTFLIDWFV